MNIQGFLMRHRLPLFDAEGAGTGGGADTGGADDGAAAAAAAATDTAAVDAAAAADAAKAPEGDPAKPADDQKDPAADPDAPTDFKLTAPEGMDQFQAEFDTFSTAATDWMKDNPAATPSDALKWAADRQAALVGEQSTAAVANYNAQVEAWDNEVKADPEIGGDKLDANLAIAKKGMTAFGGQELVDAMNLNGMGSNLAMVRAFVKIGNTVADTAVVKSADGSARKSMADTLYPDK